MNKKSFIDEIYFYRYYNASIVPLVYTSKIKADYRMLYFNEDVVQQSQQT